MNPTIVFVGQGPNQTVWKDAVARGAFSLNLDSPLPKKFQQSKGRVEAIERYASNFCSRLAITGSIGRRLAKLAGYNVKAREELRFYAKHARRNLNAKWNGKSGKGDVFDREEGGREAERILNEGFDRHVLLGREVATCFGLGAVPWLEEKLVHNDQLNKPQRFLVFPHPSGLSTWWNEPFNEFRARKRLREFLA